MLPEGKNIQGATPPRGAVPSPAPGSDSTGIGGLLHRHEAGVQEASTELVALVAAEIRRIAPRHHRERTTAIAPEEQLTRLLSKLLSDSALDPADRAPFLTIYARAVRRVVCDRLAERGTAGLEPDVAGGISPAPELILAIDDVLTSLAHVNARLVSVVECLYYARLTEDETAAALRADAASVQREWMRARAWLLKELTGEAAPAPRREVSVTNAVWVDAVLRNAVALPLGERGEFLEQCHAAAPGLRKDVEDLLRLSDPALPGPRPGDLSAAALWSCLAGTQFVERADPVPAAADVVPAFERTPPIADVMEPVTPTALPAPDEATPMIGHWRILRDLGGGPMGALYLVEREGYGSRAAARRLPLVDPTGVRQQFAHECRPLLALRHPRLAGILDSGETSDGHLFIVRDYVEGQTIDRYCADQNLGLAARVKTVVRVCSAVQQAHRRLIAHGALDASKIYVDRDGEVTLVDCGVAPMLSSLTATAGPGGWRPAAGSPELLRGEAVTVMSDVYQLGALLRELLTRDAPLVGRLPEDLDAIIALALRDDPDKRYPSVSALRSDLQRWLDRRPIWARRNSHVYRAGRFFSRRRVPLALAAAVVMVGSIVLPPFLGDNRADQSADRAAQVNRLLAGMLAPTSQAGGPEPPTARTFVDQAATIVRQEFASQPAEQARLLLAVGTSYAAIGHYPSAIEVLEEALVLQRSAHGDDATAVADVLEPLGQARHVLGRYDEADASLRLAVAIRSRRLGASHPATLSANVSLAALLASRGQLLEAEPILRASVEASDADQAGEVWPRAMAALAGVLRERGHRREAEAAYRRTLARYESSAAPRTADHAGTQVGLALLLLRRSELAEAEALLAAALPTLRRHYHPEHPLLLDSLLAQARLRIEQDRLDDARGALQQAERIQQQSLRTFHLAVPATRALHAELARRENRFEDAVASTRMALEEFDRLALPDHPSTIEIRATLADALIALGRGDEAIPVLGRAIAAAETLSPAGDDRTTRLRASLLGATSARPRD